jgi:hypothetical protein
MGNIPIVDPDRIFYHPTVLGTGHSLPEVIVLFEAQLEYIFSVEVSSGRMPAAHLGQSGRN